MQDLNFVNDPVNPNYIIIVKLNTVDEAYSNVKRTIMLGAINKQQYSKLIGEVIYLWEHLKPIVEEIKSKLEKKLKYTDEIIALLNSDDIPTYKQIKKIVEFFHSVCYHGNITRPKVFVYKDPAKNNMLNS